VIPFDNYGDWNAYVKKEMPEAGRYQMGIKISIQSNQKTGRVLAEWDGLDYGYVLEGRHNKLLRVTYRIGDRR